MHQKGIKVARPHRLQELEQEHSTPLDQLIPDLVNRLGTQKAAADHLGISQATISTWLKAHGYTPRTIYMKEGEEINERVISPAG
jgi:hypothetical protein